MDLYTYMYLQYPISYHAPASYLYSESYDTPESYRYTESDMSQRYAIMKRFFKPLICSHVFHPVNP